ncbi:hypothetical protein D1007_16733 [Hordeum vulgare]|uniref:uncharacterized protein LOC123408063 n=1 Tax=Hordeum vulgare subsp. vulgare TaxID=112509 RepID=UPI001D1A5637|nr:uncharacterized protein LOC123408063 [Hordeum vulgare subsp. vulgare]KAE8807053.1 hypothetical protein D1007_16733 [Hordeum vulgare]
MVRATAPTRRPPWGAAIALSTASQSFDRRVALSAAAAGGICSQPRHPSINNRLWVPDVVSRGHGRAKKACSCSPTTHPGSFRCALHRGPSPAPEPVSGWLHHARRSATANSLVRTALVEGGDHVRRALAALVRHSSHHQRQRRRSSFRALPSRLSAMSAAAAELSPSTPP